MYKPLNLSAFLNNFTELKPMFPKAEEYRAEGVKPYVFISMHIAEEGKGDYPLKMKEMCQELRNMGYELIADVSKRTLKYFNNSDIFAIAKEYGISILRPDFGFDLDELKNIARNMPICLNATNLKIEEVDDILLSGQQVYAMHNYYPRTETGLDEEFFRTKNKELLSRGIPVMAFISSDINKRGPIYDGLPTLEYHRHLSPYIAYLDMVINYNIDNIYVGDGVISKGEMDLIDGFRSDNIIRIPIKTFSDQYDEVLFGRVYTIRDDSPRWLKRLMESRQFSSFGQRINPGNIQPRKAGSITIDNERYRRYSGEIQVIIEDLPLDEKVNVIGKISEKYQDLSRFITNGRKISFINKSK